MVTAKVGQVAPLKFLFVCDFFDIRYKSIFITTVFAIHSKTS